MEDHTSLLTVLVLLVGVLLWVALAVYPFDYGFAESAGLVGLLVLVGLFELVLDDAVVGE